MYILYTSILGCLKDIEFQCNSSVCIDMIRRCDTVQDCENGIDEEECGKIDPSITLPKLKRHLLFICIKMGKN